MTRPPTYEQALKFKTVTERDEGDDHVSIVVSGLDALVAGPGKHFRPDAFVVLGVQGYELAVTTVELRLQRLAHDARAYLDLELAERCLKRKGSRCTQCKVDTSYLAPAAPASRHPALEALRTYGVPSNGDLTLFVDVHRQDAADMRAFLARALDEQNAAEARWRTLNRQENAS